MKGDAVASAQGGNWTYRIECMGATGEAIAQAVQPGIDAGGELCTHVMDSFLVQPDSLVR